jgi:hypothetical protein
MLRPLWIIASLAMVTGLGCRVDTEPAYGYTEVSAAPVEIDVESYPHTYYAGRPVYYYRDRWYYREGPRWYYYRQEPAPLYQYRQRGYVQEAPPAPRYSAPPTSAPPAVRVP